MTLQYDTTVRTDWCSDLNTAIGTDAIFKFYTGAPPANCAAGATGTLLSSGCIGDATAFGVASAGVLTANTIANDTSAANTGTAGYFRLCDSGGGVHLQGTCGTSGTDMIMNSTTITAGDTVEVTSFVLTAPGA